MAKMFYTLDEAAAKLGVSEDQVKQLAEEGKLQQFRDRDKVMYKREAVDELFGMSRTMKMDKPGKPGEESGIRLADVNENKSSKTDTIDLLADTDMPSNKASDTKKSATATGISVFDADEVEAADPMAQTQVTKDFRGAEDELSLESVGSGSGLLDLTRESDDTSLGAVELLEDIGPGGDSDAKMASGGALPGSSTGIFESAGGVESHPSALSSLEEGPSEAPVYVMEEESADPAWDGFAGFAMFGVMAVLIVGLIVVITGMQGLIIDMTAKLVEQPMYFAGMFIGCLVLGAIGLFIGKAGGKKKAEVAA